jgi:hypothetical protein
VRTLIAVKRVLALAVLFCGFSAAAAAAGDACSSLAATVDAVPAGPVFLASYPAGAPRELRNVAFLYDNAVAAIALIGCGETGRARRIGDAILAAQAHDRFWRDGRLRNAYAAGAVGAGPVKLSGWWDTAQNRWVEDAYQAGSDSGNLAWAALALLALDRATAAAQFRQGAVRLADWLAGQGDARGPGGFTGGVFGFEPAPSRLLWKSTEHNVDLAAVFSSLAAATGDPRWAARAQAARRFVRAMWDDRCRCFAAGTGLDGAAPNRLLALDAQVFPGLALPSLPSALPTIRRRLGDAGGFAYSAARGGVWTEGTAQVALLLALSGKTGDAARLEKILAAQRAPNGGYYASSTLAAPTGFALDTDPSQARRYFHIPHLAAAAWVALAQRRFNPLAASR